MANRFRLLSAAVVALFVIMGGAFADSGRWFKGNLHTHSFWSDGDNYPELIAEWYKTNGYDFLAFSDHNSIQEGEKWTVIGETNAIRKLALEAYLKRFGTNWVEMKKENGETHVRLKQLKEYQDKIAVPGKFLLMPGEEVSDRHLSAPIHMGAINVKEFVKPNGGTSVVEVLNNNINAVYEQRKRTGQPMFPHINHPNFGWALTAEEMMQIKNDRFFEVYNGHPHVHNTGDDTHASTERIWDIILARRLAHLKLPVVYGIGTDDSHHYHQFEPMKSNPGRGWIMVRATALTPKKIIEAMEKGDFYASSGVTLKTVERKKSIYRVEVDPEPGVTYTIQFLGTRRGFDTNSEPLRASSGTPLRLTHRYSKDIGMILAETKGTVASYKPTKEDLYVRAKVISSKPLRDTSLGKTAHRPKMQADKAGQPNGAQGEFESAWTQPFVN